MSEVKILWDEYRETKQFTEGRWQLIEQPDPPMWFVLFELGRVR